MTFRLIQSATSFGALDKDAIIDGASFGAMQARVMARQANRLIKKRHQILNLIWPITTQEIDDQTQYRFEGSADTTWKRLLPGIPVLKKPGTTEATVYFRVRSSSSGLFIFGVGSERVEYQHQTVAIAGTGSWQWASLNIALDPGPQERLSFWYIEDDSAVPPLMDTAVYGTPNTGTINVNDVWMGNWLEEYSSPRPTWTNSMAAKHFIRFLNDGSAFADRQILSVLDKSNHHMITYLPLGRRIVQRYIETRNASSRITYEIRQMVKNWFAIGQILVVTNERVF